MKYIPPKYEARGFNCPHCGAYSVQKWYYPTYGTGGVHIEGLALSRCDFCDRYSVWVEKKIYYPITSSAPLASEDMPEEVEEIYNEARDIAHLSHRGAAALLRLSLQKLVIALGEKGKDLNKDIGNLVKRKELPKKVIKSLDSVRIYGNYAVHPGEIDLKDDLETTNKLFLLVNLICEYAITQPAKVDELFEKIPEEKKEAIKKRDGETR